MDHNFNILRNSDIHTYNTRRRNDFRLPLVKRNYGRQTPFYQCAKEWNLFSRRIFVLNRALKVIYFFLSLRAGGILRSCPLTRAESLATSFTSLFVVCE